MNTISSLTIALFSIGVIILFLLSSFFSACEVAIVSSPKYKWDSSKYSQKKKTINKIVHIMLDKYSLSLAAILIGNTFANVACSSIVSTFFVTLYGEWVVGLVTGILTFLVLLFCEFFPKNITKYYSLSVLYYFAYPLFFFWIIFWPFGYVFNLVFKKNKNLTVSERDLSFLVKAVESEGVLEQTEALLINNALAFDEKMIDNIYTKKITTISIDMNYKMIYEIFKKSKFSRVPIINLNDKILGILNYKDFSFWYINNINNLNSFNLKELMIDKFLIVKKTDSLDKVLRLMQRNNSHLGAIIKNDKLIGIVTIEMLIEEIVGKIYDEKDINHLIKNVNQYTWIVDPKINANVFFKNNFEIPLAISNNKLSLFQYVLDSFKIKKIRLDDVFENDELKITIIKGKSGKFLFEINEKTNLIED